MIEARLAIAFLTRLPLGTPQGSARQHAASTRYFPLVGGVLAVLVVAALLVGSWFFDRNAGCVMALVAWVWLTGGLHLDGLGDCIDGIATEGSSAKRLQAMHDPRIGGLGAVGLVLWILLKLALIARCVDAGTIAQAVWCALVFARAPAAFELAEGEPATAGQGMFAWLHAEMRTADWVIAILVAIALLTPAVAPMGTLLARAAVGVVAGSMCTLVWHLGWYKRIGGLNGDVLGGAIEIREVVMLAAMGIQLPW